MEAREVKKLYYSISEVSQITGLKQYVLRYWETEFSQLQPNKNRAGNRTYKSYDVELILQIKSLLYERKFTIKGAQQYLKSSSSTSIERERSDTKVLKLIQSADIQALKKIKNNLDDIITFLEEHRD